MPSGTISENRDVVHRDRFQQLFCAAICSNALGIPLQSQAAQSADASSLSKFAPEIVCIDFDSMARRIGKAPDTSLLQRMSRLVATIRSPLRLEIRSADWGIPEAVAGS